jgi:membrane-associated phospholipid phosphatase
MFLRGLLLFVLSFSFAYGELKSRFFDAPSFDRVTQAAVSATNTYHFRIPFVLGVLAFAFDGRISDAATRHTPLFGSQENAEQWSDALVIGLVPMMIYSAFQSDLPNKDEPVYLTRAKFIGFQSLIILADFAIVTSIKNSSKRVRPDQSDDLSFPSGHSSVSSGMSRTVFNNINNSRHENTTFGRIIQGTAFTSSILAAWGRVEAKKHHLSDVLLGNAFGAFISDFLYATFLEEPTKIETAFFINGHQQSMKLSYSF